MPPSLRLLKTAELSSELVSDVERVVATSDGDLTVVIEREYVSPIAWLIRQGAARLLSSQEYEYSVEQGRTIFRFYNLFAGDVVVVHSSGNVLSVDTFVVGDPQETFTRTEAFYIYADGANFTNVVVKAEDLAEGALGKKEWVKFSLDGSSWSDTLTIPMLKNGTTQRVFFRVSVPPQEAPVGSVPDLVVSVTGTAVV